MDTSTGLCFIRGLMIVLCFILIVVGTIGFLLRELDYAFDLYGKIDYRKQLIKNKRMKKKMKKALLSGKFEIYKIICKNDHYKTNKIERRIRK